MKALSFDDISLVPRYNNIASRKDVDTSIQFGPSKLRIPVLSSNMDTVTGAVMAKKMYELGGIGFLHRFCTIEHNVEMYLASTTPFASDTVRRAVVSLGVNEGLNRFKALYRVGARYFCIDIAHGHSQAVGDTIKAIKEFYGDAYVIAGNVCTVDGALFLTECGADAIKVGIGPGSVCTTRLKTGFGVPQFTAIRECRNVGAFIIADGGIRTPGDAVKAFVAGADAVMLGGMLSGTDETPGELVQDRKLDGTPIASYHKSFRGMASKEAQEDYMGFMNDWKTAEGIEIKVKAKGPVENVLADLMGGIRSGMTYCGANNLRQLRERADWVEITAFGRAEGLPHGEGRL